jgi:predicted NBD/HSP70 family sugar kinase
MPALIFDLGGTFLRCAVSTEKGGTQLVRKERITSYIGGVSPPQVWDAIVNQMIRYQESVAGVVCPDDPIVLSFPGPISRHQRVLNAPTVFGDTLNIPDPCTDLQRRTGRETYVLNDVSAAAWYLSEQTEVNRFLVITVSSGVGAKLFDRDHPDRVISDPPYAGEIGHMAGDSDSEAILCDCGGRGHVGAISSGRGIERLARRAAKVDPIAFEASACAGLGADAATLSNEDHLVPAALDGDKWALSLITNCTRPLARAVLSVTLGAGLEQVIFIGGFASALGDVYLRIMRGLLEELSQYSILAGYLPGLLRLGEMGEEASLQGAAIFANRVALPELRMRLDRPR